MTDDKDLALAVDLLSEYGCSCVICNQGAVTRCERRGVADLLNILHDTPAVLAGAAVADKVVGKGAAALMIVGGVRTVYAAVLSRPAKALFDAAAIPVRLNTLVPNIINRAGTGLCPVESLCMECNTPQECVPLIEQFVATLTSNTN